MRWFNSAAPCLTAEWRLKAALSIRLSVMFCVFYFTLQHLTLWPVRTFALTRVDEAVVFDPAWVWAYQSVYLLVAIVPWLSTSRAQLVRYAKGFLLLSSMGFLCFLLFPVAGPRPDVVPTTGMFGWLVWYDQPRNAFPSLHVGLASYSLMYGARISQGVLPLSARRPLLSAGIVWAGAIAYGALATKQHYAIDLPAGLVLAWVAHRWSWRDVPFASTGRSIVNARTLAGSGQ